MPGELPDRSDQQITLGSPNNRDGAVPPAMRLVSAQVEPSLAAQRHGQTTQTYQLITERFDLTPLEVVQGYHWRWQIETFFRWLKSQLHLDWLLGYSVNAIKLMVAVALLVLLATQALQMRRGPRLLALRPWASAHLSWHDAPADAAPH